MTNARSGSPPSKRPSLRIVPTSTPEEMSRQKGRLAAELVFCEDEDWLLRRRVLEALAELFKQLETGAELR